VSTFNAGAIEANLTLGRSGWTKDLQKTKKEIAELEKKSITIGVDLDTDNAQVSMDNLELFLEDLDGKEYSPTIDLIVNDAMQALEEFEARLDALDARRVLVSADADTDNAIIALDNLENHMDVLENDPIQITADVDIDRATAGLTDLEAMIEMFDDQTININADMDSAAAIAQMETLALGIEALDGRDIDIAVDFDQAAMASLVGTGGEAGGSLGLLKILMYAIIALSPVLAVATSAATAAVIGFAAAAAGAVGAVAGLAAGIAALVYRFNSTDPSEYTPAMQKFADAIQMVKDAWVTFTDSIETPGFELMAQGVELLALVIPSLTPLFLAVADAMSGVLDGIKDWIGSPEYQEMIDFFSGFGVDMLVSFLKIGGNLIRFFGRLFQAIAPFAEEMMKGLEGVTQGWMDWADDLENNKGFQDFVDNALEYGPMLLDMLGSLVQAFMNLGEALEPFAGPMIEALTWLFDLIANADPTALSAIIAVLAGLWLGFNVLAPVISTVAGAFTALAAALGIGLGPLLLIVAAVAAIGAAVWYLWETNEGFREAIIDSWNEIYAAIAPIVQAVVDLFMENWPAIKDFLMGLWEDISSIIGDALIIIMQNFEWMGNAIQAFWSLYGEYIMNTVKTAFQTIGGVIKGALQTIKGIFQVFSGLLTGDWKKMFEGLKNVMGGPITIIKALFNQIKSTFENVVNGVKNGITTMVNFFKGLPGKVSGAVKNAFSGLWTAFKGVLNDMIRAWNNLSFTVDIPDKIPGLPDKFTINTPNVPLLAEGAYLNEATLAVVGEAGPEIVAPEPVLERIVSENSGSNIDYGRLAAAVAAAFGGVLTNFGLATRDDIERLIEAAGVQIDVDARSEGFSTKEFIQRLMFELRVLGYGGVRNA
jgi:phage-related protein